MTTFQQQELSLILSTFSEISTKHDLNFSLFGGSALGAVRHADIIPWDDDIDIVMMPEEYAKLLKLVDSFTQSTFYLQVECSEGYELPFSKYKNSSILFREYGVPYTRENKHLYIDIMGLVYTYRTPLLQLLHYSLAKVLLAITLYRSGRRFRSSYVLISCIASTLSFLLPSSLSLIKAFRAFSPKKTDHVAHFFGKASFKKSIYPSSWFDELSNLYFGGRIYPITASHHSYLTLRYGSDYMQLPSQQVRQSYPLHGEIISAE